LLENELGGESPSKSRRVKFGAGEEDDREAGITVAEFLRYRRQATQP
jgi:hypothetical protein